MKNPGYQIRNVYLPNLERVVGTAHFLLSRTLIRRLSLRVRLNAARHDVL